MHQNGSFLALLVPSISKTVKIVKISLTMMKALIERNPMQKLPSKLDEN